MKKVLAVNTHTDLYKLSDDEFIDKVVLLFASKSEGEYYKVKEYVSNKPSKSYYIVDLEDIAILLEDEQKRYPEERDIQAYVNSKTGYLCREEDVIYPNFKDLEKVVSYINEHVGEEFIIGCSAGKSRTGALYKYLSNKGYSLSKKGNKKFNVNMIIYEVMMEIDKKIGKKSAYSTEIGKKTYEKLFVKEENLVD